MRKTMLIITGIIKTSSEKELEQVKSALIKRAAKSRQDEGNIDYAFSVNIEDPTEIRLTEKWESEELLNAHLQIPDEEFSAVVEQALRGTLERRTASGTIRRFVTTTTDFGAPGLFKLCAFALLPFTHREAGLKIKNHLPLIPSLHFGKLSINFGGEITVPPLYKRRLGGVV